MRAFTLDSFDAPPRLREDLAEPRPAANELLVRVRTSSVNGADAAVTAGVMRELAEHTFPVTLGATSRASSKTPATTSAATSQETRSSASCR